MFLGKERPMTRPSRSHSRSLSAILLSTAVVLTIVFSSVTQRVTGAEASMKNSPAMQLVSLGMKFNGSASCKGNGCHNKAGDDTPPKEGLHELTIWKSKDRHAKAFDTLSNDDSKKIGTALKI